MLDGDNKFDNPGGADPFSIGGAGGMGSKPKSKVSAQTVILGVIVVVGAGLLFGMRKFGMGPVMDLTAVQINYEPNPETEKERAEFNEVLGQLASSSERFQVPGTWIQRDPFMINGTNVEEPEDVQIPAEDPDAIERRRLASEVDRAIDNVEVQSAMGGRVPIVRINGETFQMGDAVEGALEIIGVEGRTVRFIGADGRIFEAEIGGKLREVTLDGPADETGGETGDSE